MHGGSAGLPVGCARGRKAIEGAGKYAGSLILTQARHGQAATQAGHEPASFRCRNQTSPATTGFPATSSVLPPLPVPPTTNPPLPINSCRQLVLR